jgi:hypothetical protein
MRHLSNETCQDQSMSDQNDCTFETFAFGTTSANGIGAMYQKIIDSVVQKGVKTTAKDVNQQPQFGFGPVQPGIGVTLPLPKTFVCQPENFTMSLQGSGYKGTLQFSHVTFRYCPAP